MAESDKLLSMDGQLNHGDTDQAGPIQEEEPVAVPPLQPLVKGMPHRVILFGDGIPSWSLSVRAHLLEYCPGKSEIQLADEVTGAIKASGFYYASSRMGEQAIIVLGCPTKIKTKDEVRTWLEWWIKLLNEWDRGGITVLLSPSKKYDPITKMTAQVLGVEGLLEEIAAKATNKYSEHQDLLQELSNRGALLRALQQHDDEHSVVGELPERGNDDRSVDGSMQGIQELADSSSASEEDLKREDSDEEGLSGTKTPPRAKFRDLPLMQPMPQSAALRQLMKTLESQKQLLERHSALLLEGLNYTPSLPLDRAPTEVEDGVPREDDAGCIHCGALLQLTQLLWDVSSALWCTSCYESSFPIQTARGVVCLKTLSRMPTVQPENIIKIEAGAMVTWTSVRADKGSSLMCTTHPDCYYFIIYSKMWEYEDGTRVSTAHFTDGRFVLIGPRLPALRDRAHGFPTTTQDASSQTEGVVWAWDDYHQEIIETAASLLHPPRSEILQAAELLTNTPTSPRENVATAFEDQTSEEHLAKAKTEEPLPASNAEAVEL